MRSWAFVLLYYKKLKTLVEVVYQRYSSMLLYIKHVLQFNSYNCLIESKELTALISPVLKNIQPTVVSLHNGLYIELMHSAYDDFPQLLEHAHAATVDFAFYYVNCRWQMYSAVVNSCG